MTVGIYEKHDSRHASVMVKQRATGFECYYYGTAEDAN